MGCIFSCKLVYVCHINIETSVTLAQSAAFKKREELKLEHCQRHSRPKGWVFSIKYLLYHFFCQSRQHLSFKSYNKLSHQNLKQTSASKHWQQISFRILTKLYLQNLGCASASKSWQKLSVKKAQPNFNFQILTQFQLHVSVVVSRSLSLKARSPTYIECSILINQAHIIQVSFVSQSVSQWQKGKEWSFQ